MDSDCIYCNISQESDHELILSNDFCVYSLLKKQEIEGAGIIVPRNHRETLFDLSQEEWNATYQLLQEVKNYIDNKYKPDGYNVGWLELWACGRTTYFSFTSSCHS
jgi:histidine triad (HIT) family protein